MKTLPLSESQKMGWDLILMRRQMFEEYEARFIGHCLLELGGKADEGWRWDGVNRQFITDGE